MCMKRKNDVNRLCVYAIIFFTVFLSGYCFSENLEEAWKQAVQSNHSLMATYQDIDAASYSLKAAKDRYRERVCPPTPKSLMQRPCGPKVIAIMIMLFTIFSLRPFVYGEQSKICRR